MRNFGILKFFILRNTHVLLVHVCVITPSLVHAHTVHMYMYMLLEDSNNPTVEAIEHVEVVNALGIGDKIAEKLIFMLPPLATPAVCIVHCVLPANHLYGSLIMYRLAILIYMY